MGDHRRPTEASTLNSRLHAVGGSRVELAHAEMMVWLDFRGRCVRGTDGSFPRPRRLPDTHLLLVGGLRLHSDGSPVPEDELLAQRMIFASGIKVSPVVASLRPTQAAMSPANTSDLARSLACIFNAPETLLLATHRVQYRSHGLPARRNTRGRA